MNQLCPEEIGPEQESPSNSVVRDYSEARELGERSQQHETGQAIFLLGITSSIFLDVQNIFFFTQASREIPLFVQGCCYMK